MHNGLAWITLEGESNILLDLIKYIMKIGESESHYQAMVKYKITKRYEDSWAIRFCQPLE